MPVQLKIRDSWLITFHFLNERLVAFGQAVKDSPKAPGYKCLRVEYAMTGCEFISLHRARLQERALKPHGAARQHDRPLEYPSVNGFERHHLGHGSFIHRRSLGRDHRIHVVDIETGAIPKGYDADDQDDC